MDYKPSKDEIEIAKARDIVSASLCAASADETTFEVLHALSVKSAMVRESVGFTTEIYEFIDGIFGASVILCGGTGCCISTKNNASGFWECDSACLEVLVFELIRSACLCTKNVVLSAKITLGSLIVTASLDNGECDINLIGQLAVKLGGSVQIVFHHSFKTVAVRLPMKKGDKKNLVSTKNSFDYICDPFSSAYIGLFDVCNNPVLMFAEE